MLADALSPVARMVRAVFVYGSIARGEEQSISDVDLIVVGNVSPVDLATPLKGSSRLIHFFHSSGTSGTRCCALFRCFITGEADAPFRLFGRWCHQLPNGRNELPDRVVVAADFLFQLGRA
jgi:hypothetical protein